MPCSHLTCSYNEAGDKKGTLESQLSVPYKDAKCIPMNGDRQIMIFPGVGKRFLWILKGE
jgi:hypothetical protein